MFRETGRGISSWKRGKETNGCTLSLFIDVRHALFALNMLNHLRKQWGDGEDCQAGEILRDGDAVRHASLLERGFPQSLNCGWGEEGVGGGDVDVFVRAEAQERFFGGAEGTGRVDHVVVQDTGTVLHVADDVDDSRLVMAGAVFMHDGEISPEQIGKLLRLLGAADIGR